MSIGPAAGGAFLRSRLARLEQGWSVDVLRFSDRSCVGRGIPSAPQRGTYRERSLCAGAPITDDAVGAGTATGDGVAQVRSLGGGQDVVGIDANAEWFIAAVFSNGVAGLGAVLQEECESVCAHSS